MKIFYGLLTIALCLVPAITRAQQQVTVISRCGGLDTVNIPTITDNDLDGMDDTLEQKLLDYFMPAIIQFVGENCPGPALDGSGDSNLIACRIYPIPEQYQLTNNINSISTHPVPVVASRALTPGLVWYNPVIKINCAVLYGQDCGLLGHVADVEGFNFSLKYIGPDTAAGWMYDMDMQHWAGAVIQTISHAGTLCQQIETLPYQSTVYASPDKHGNYLTISQCGASFICNPGCSGTQYRQSVKNVNLGEANASLVPDLGVFYAAYAGEDPWSTSNFLNSHGGNAGAIRDKMLLPLTSDFIGGLTLTQPQICPLYLNCFGQTGSAYLHYACSGTSYGFYNQQLTAPGVYQFDTINSYGCDSIITLTLSFVNPDTTLQSATICANSNYAFFGQQLNASGVYQQILANTNGCDSTILLTLTVNPLDTTLINTSICANGSYAFNGQQLDSAGMYQQILTNTNGCDSTVILTLAVNPLDTTLINASICANGSYAFNGQQLDSAGVYQQILTNTSGCDSLVLLTLTVNPADSSFISESICYNGMTVFNGQFLNVAGDYTAIFQNQFGCDSIVVLSLTVIQADTTSISVSICQGASYSFSGQQLSDAGVYIDTLLNTRNCDSLVLLTLTVLATQNDTVQHAICQGDSYQGHTDAGTYVDSLVSATGCDSIVATILTVDPLPTTPVVAITGNLLTTDTTGIASYQWYQDTVAITGADSSHYVATVTGYYHVVVTNGFGCANISDSILVTLVGIAETGMLTGITISPNPTDGKLMVRLPIITGGQAITVELLNVLGERVINPIYTSNTYMELDLQYLSKGLYLVRVTCGDQQWIGKVVKE